MDRARRVVSDTSVSRVDTVKKINISSFYSNIMPEFYLKKTRYFEIFWAIVGRTENLIVPLDRARRVLQDTLLNFFNTDEGVNIR